MSGPEEDVAYFFTTVSNSFKKTCNSNCRSRVLLDDIKSKFVAYFKNAIDEKLVVLRNDIAKKNDEIKLLPSTAVEETPKDPKDSAKGKKPEAKKPEAKPSKTSARKPADDKPVVLTPEQERDAMLKEEAKLITDLQTLKGWCQKATA